jgi:hypothetical protein
VCSSDLGGVPKVSSSIPGHLDGELTLIRFRMSVTTKSREKREKGTAHPG